MTTVRVAVLKLGPLLASACLCACLLTEVCAAADAAAPAEDADQGGIAEVTVTAERFKSTVQDTPISMTALSSEQLNAAGLTDIESIAHEVPGLSMRSAGPGLTEYEARGIASNGGAAPTVGFYLDDIPLSPPALSQSGKVVIDPNLYDLDRVEVLRGPQGTLYGSGSMGGTVKLVTTQPKLGQFEGSAQGTVSDTYGGGANGGGNLMLNIPLGEVLALRVVAGDQYRSGWIDNVTLSPFPISPTSTHYTASLTSVPVQSVIHDANDVKIWGERASLLFQPSAGFSVLAFFFEQHMALGGYDLLDATPTSALPGTVYDAHYEAFPLREGLHDDIKIYGLTANIDLGFADLTSATSYWDRLNWQAEDSSVSLWWTNAASALSQGSPSFPALAPVLYSEVDPSHQFSQELRLASHDIAGWHWVAGAFFSRLQSVWQEESASPATIPFGVPDGSYFTSYNPYTVSQKALFADGSYAITSHWKLAAGVRWYSYDSNQHEYSWGYDGPSPVPPAQATLTQASNRGFNPRINLSYEPTKDLNTYVTAAKGFRPGGANQIIPPPNEPPFCSPGTLQFQPDTVWNFEAGEKARLLGNRLTINGDVYYIKWDGVQQVFTLTCGYQFYNNAGNGRSYGPELEINARLSEEWTLSLNGAWTDAKITRPSAGYQSYLSTQVTEPDGVTHPCPVTGNCTVPIMNVPKDTASAALIYSRPFGDYRLTARVDDSYVGTSTDVAYYFGYTLPSYNIANARLILAHDRLSIHLFVDNLTDKAALTTANNTSFQFNIPQLVRYSTNQPRTFGTQVNYRF